MIRSGLVGRAIGASRSPWLHEEEARAQSLDLRYELTDFTALGLPDGALGDVLRRLRDEGFAGVNVTYPFKQLVVAHLDELDETAAAVGAVNTVAMRDGRLIGYNTDMSGFRDSMAQGLPEARLDRVLQLGAGGAGSAVASALLALGVEHLEIADVDPVRSAGLAATLNARMGGQRVIVRDIGSLTTDKIDGIVNATPMGMAANPAPPLDPALIAPHHWVADIVYFPLVTELLKAARAKGCAVLNGSGMVVSQAALAFEIITGYRADKQRMRASFFAK